MTKRMLSCWFVAILLATTACADQIRKPYQGMEKRGIASLSESDIAQIEQGAGWGLALPAELNGYPGPIHVLDLQDELGLSPEQIAKTESTYSRMNEQAINLGREFIAAEVKLTLFFKDGSVDLKELEKLTEKAALIRGQLRLIHLTAHIAMVEILTEEQIELYMQFRGYEKDNCSIVPAGHDPSMWREHHNCSESSSFK
ncbi:MAG: hypothetical protein AB8G18_00990 [Gammaproteobacteria bacterium]